MRGIAKAIFLGGLFTTAVVWSGAAQAQCTPLPRAEPGNGLLSQDYSGDLILGPIVSQGKRPLTWKTMHHLDGRCYLMPENLRYGELKFAINNHLDEQIDEKDAGSRFDLGVQIIKVSVHTRGEPKETEEITAQRSLGYSWYRNGRAFERYAPKTKTLELAVSAWNDAHDPGNVIEQNDRILEGPFHASPSPRARSTFQERRWWRVNEKLPNDYKLRVENRLLSALPASGDLAGGIPFQTNARGYDALIIRYASANVDIEDVVTLCFANCDAIEKIKLRSSDREVLAILFPWIR
jgi:hypothetical protein